MWRRHAAYIIIFGRYLVVYGPVLAAYVLLFYVLAALAYMITHPRMWVRGVFALIDLAPAAFAAAFEEFWDETKKQVGARFR